MSYPIRRGIWTYEKLKEYVKRTHTKTYTPFLNRVEQSRVLFYFLCIVKIYPTFTRF
nr:MAG TPA: hypothetical protein [Caudoviricetes sp.]